MLWFGLSMICMAPGLFLTHDGCNESGLREALLYFDNCLEQNCFTAIHYRFCVSIIDWTAPPKMYD